MSMLYEVYAKARDADLSEEGCLIWAGRAGSDGEAVERGESELRRLGYDAWVISKVSVTTENQNESGKS